MLSLVFNNFPGSACLSNPDNFGKPLIFNNFVGSRAEIRQLLSFIFNKIVGSGSFEVGHFATA